MNHAIAAVKQRFHLGRYAENIVRAGQDETVTGEQLFLDALVVIFYAADPCLVADVAGNAGLYIHVFQGEDFGFSSGLRDSGQHFLQKAAGVPLHPVRAAYYGEYFHCQPPGLFYRQEMIFHDSVVLS